MLTGRTRELEAVTEAFLSGAPLVTLAGPGGIGKTRLARELARRSPSAHFVDLSAAETTSALVDQVGLALGLSPGADLAAALGERGPLLVVLDDFDALLPEGRTLLERWLERAPEVSWLVTARGRLGLGDERVVELGGLSLPDGDLEASEAFALFVRRAELAGAALKPEELPFAAELVTELGGSPLAIELAASRLGVMNVRALLHRVRSDPRVLARETGPARHRSLELAFESSWAGLGAEEQQALAALSFFRGGFELEAAEAVLGEVLPGADALALVQRLRDRCLLSSSEQSRLDLPPALAPIVRLKAGERVRIEAAHARYYLGWAEHHRHEVARELPNLMAIVSRVTRAGTRAERHVAEDALAALWLLAPEERARLPLAQCLEAVSPVVERSESSGARPLLFARGLLLRGEALWWRDRSDRALADLARAEGMARALGDRELEILALCRLAEAAIERERLEEARALLARADPDATDVIALSAVAAAVERDPRAEALLDRAATRAAAAGDFPRAARMRLELARLELDRGDAARARARVEELLRSAALTRPLAAEAEIVLARILQDAGEAENALGRLEHAASELRAVGASFDAAIACAHAGIAAREAGRSALAHVLLTDALSALGAARPSERAILHLYLAALETEAGDASASAAQRERALGAHEPTARAMLQGAASELAIAPDARLRAFGRAARRAESGASPPADALLVARDGSWFRPPGGARVSLEKRRPLARLLQKLAETRTDRDDRDALIEAGWPGERILPSAAVHRLRVAMSTLRKLGLGECLVTTEDGYRLRPGTRLVVID